MALRAAWERYWFTPAAPFWLAACRILIGLQVLAYLLSSRPWDPLSRLGVLPGLPLALWEPVSFVGLLGLGPPGEAALTVVWIATVVASLAVVAGLATRPACAVAAAGGLYLLTLPQCFGKVNHGQNVLAMMLLVLPFSRAGAAWSADALLRRARGASSVRAASEFNWPVKLIGFSFALMLFFAGWSKLVHAGPEWALSENLRHILAFQNLVVRAETPPSPLVGPIVEHPWLWKPLAAGVLLTELGFVAIMFVRRTWQRLALVGLAAAFLLGLGALMQLPNPTLLGLLPVFVDWNRLAARRRGAGRALRPAAAPPPERSAPGGVRLGR